MASGRNRTRALVGGKRSRLCAIPASLRKHQANTTQINVLDQEIKPSPTSMAFKKPWMKYSGVIIQIEDFSLFFLAVISGTKLFWLTAAPNKPKCVTPFNSQGAVYYVFI